MKLLNESIEKQVREVLVGMEHPVHILVFSSQGNCHYCEENLQLAQEVVALSDKLSLEARDLQADSALASQYHVTETPAMVIMAKDGEQLTDLGVRLLGIPSGHDFSAFIQDILLVSSRDSGLSPATRDFLKTIDKPVHLQVFVTPT